MRGMKTFLMVVFCVAGVSIMAADFSFSKLSDYNIGKKPGLSATADGFFFKTQKDRMDIMSNTKMPVSMDKKYCFSGSVRLPEGCTQSGRFWIGLRCLDKAGKEIAVTSCNGIPNTMTTLAKEVKVGDKDIYLQDASQWKNQYTHVAFGAKADWSDIPNRTFSPKVSEIIKEGDIWKLTLVRPMNKEYPAGTSVRLHRDGATYLYSYCNIPTGEWKNFKVNLKGVSQTEAVGSYGKFRPGTAFIQVCIFCENGKPCGAEFKDISIVEVQE